MKKIVTQFTTQPPDFGDILHTMAPGNVINGIFSQVGNMFGSSTHTSAQRSKPSAARRSEVVGAANKEDADRNLEVHYFSGLVGPSELLES